MIAINTEKQTKGMDDDITIKISSELVDLQNQLKTNIKNEVDRTSGLKKLNKRTEKLQQRGALFKKRTEQVERKMWWKSMKYWIIGGVILFVVVLVIYQVFFK